jgi:hypothetical protein
MITIIGYALILIGATIIPAIIGAYILSYPIMHLLKKLESDPAIIICQLITESVAGLLMLWFSVLLFTWLNIRITWYMPLVLTIVISMWNLARAMRFIGHKNLMLELTSLVGNLIGILIGIYYFIIM